MVQSKFEVGDDILASFRFVKVQEIFTGPDGKTWIRAWWPAVATDYEFESNRRLEEKGFKVHYYGEDRGDVVWNHGIVEGPEDLFR